MRGTSSPDEKLTGGLANGLGAIVISESLGFVSLEKFDAKYFGTFATISAKRRPEQVQQRA
jgi:hypothetical protein